jgi:putative flippase GtrA
MPSQTFRYLFCGGSNTVLNIFIYSVSYNMVLHGHDFPLFGNVAITARVMAWIIAFSISFPIGFTLSRYIVFPESNLRGRIQLFRYGLTTVTFIAMNYMLIKFFATYLPHIWPTVSYAFVNIIIAVMSYISQRKFTFTSTAMDSVLDEEVVPD